LYVRDEVGSVTRPLRELKGFRRVGLEAGAARTVEFRVPVRDLGVWGSSMKFAVEPGTFRVFVGSNSTAELAAGFEVVAR
jgi:beta-glucosidase